MDPAGEHVNLMHDTTTIIIIIHVGFDQHQQHADARAKYIHEHNSMLDENERATQKHRAVYICGHCACVHTLKGMVARTSDA